VGNGVFRASKFPAAIDAGSRERKMVRGRQKLIVRGGVYLWYVKSLIISFSALSPK